MTLPNEDVMTLLHDRFLIGHRNIERERHVGLSHGYKPTQTAVGTTNGAGGRNVQLVVLAADETVLHVLPGFWHAQDLVAELGLALELHRLHADDTMPPAAKRTMFEALHRSHLRRHGEAAAARSDWQGFDRHAEVMRNQLQPRDTFAPAVTGGAPVLKSVLQVVHERLIARPFKQLAEFGMESFVDYGRAYYDNNMGVDRGRDFQRAAQANQKREREQAKAARAAQQGQPQQGQPQQN